MLGIMGGGSVVVGVGRVGVIVFFVNFIFSCCISDWIYGCKIVYYLCMKILFVYVYYVSICV